MPTSTQTAETPRRGKTHPPSKNRVWDFFGHTYSCTQENWQITQCSRPENDPTPTTTVSGVHYYGYRYYSPELGRWVNRDPIGDVVGQPISVGLPAGEHIEGFEPLYEFVLNDPIAAIDGHGLHTFAPGSSFNSSLFGLVTVAGAFTGSEMATGNKAQCLVAKLLGSTAQSYIPWGQTLKATFSGGSGLTKNYGMGPWSHKHCFISVSIPAPNEECKFARMIRVGITLMHEAYHYYDWGASENTVENAIDIPAYAAVAGAYLQQESGVCGTCCYKNLMEKYMCECKIDICPCQ